MDSPEAELLDMNQRLLDSIARGDWGAYQEMCDPNLTAFEPEAHGALVEGLHFHYFFFDLRPRGTLHAQTTMIAPKVRSAMGQRRIASVTPAT